MGKPAWEDRARELRKEGLSYSEVVRILIRCRFSNIKNGRVKSSTLSLEEASERLVKWVLHNAVYNYPDTTDATDGELAVIKLCEDVMSFVKRKRRTYEK